MILKRLKNEYWYGGCVSDGIHMPIKPDEQVVFNLDINSTPNQSMPLFLSNFGRYLWADKGFTISFSHDEIKCPDFVEIGENYGNLRSAYLVAMRKHFPFHNIRLSNKLFQYPIFNSWIEMTFNQNQNDLLQYARSIITHGFTPGVFMIDAGWSESNGDWRFHSGKFPRPKIFLEQLHKMGFSTMVWICPFVTPDTVVYRKVLAENLLIKTPEGDPFITKWWDGYSAVLDMSNPNTVQWLDDQLEYLKNLGVDGFKFDAGDSIYYRDDNITYGMVSSDEQSRLWATYGEKFPLNEYRATFKAGGYSLFQRLCDKEHSWGEKGLAALIPDTLAQGITGHPFCCADMVGGGEYINFQMQEKNGLDAELFVRHSGISCLMPSIQFSAAPWRYLNEKQFKQIQEQIELRRKFNHYLMSLIDDTKKNGEPIVMYMEYVFPHAGMESITDQFMLGKNILVAPIYRKGEVSRNVFVPDGKWKFGDIMLNSKGEKYVLTPHEGLPIILIHAES